MPSDRDPNPGQSDSTDHFANARTRFWIALVASFFLHLIMGGGLALAPNHVPLPRQKTASVDLMSPEELKALMEKAQANPPNSAKQIVETSEKRLNDEVDSKAKFLSRFDQRVERETKAAKNAKFQNDGGKGIQAKNMQPSPPVTTPERMPIKEERAIEKSVAEKVQAFENGDIATGLDELDSVKPKQGLAALTPNFRKLPKMAPPTPQGGDGREESATDDHLKDVQTGMQTMLSTREFMYYSYYNRIKDKLRQYWEPKIKEKFERIVRQGRHIASDGDKITKVIIILDEKGTLIRVQVLSASGVQDLDEAAVEAFRAAAPFPNPPKGIVEEDGTIKIRWDFVLEA